MIYLRTTVNLRAFFGEKNKAAGALSEKPTAGSRVHAANYHYSGGVTFGRR